MKVFLIAIGISLGIFHQGTIAAQDVKICLAILIKGEPVNIQKCLASTVNIVDCVCICDAGSSSEKTTAAVQGILQASSVPFRIVMQDWVHLAHNNALLIQTAKKMLSDLNFNLENTYLLILSPEMQLAVAPTFQKATLIDDAYFILEKSFPLSYSGYHLHLLRASLPWYSNGTLLTDWSCHSPFHISKVETLRIDELEEAKCESDLVMLNDELLTNPDRIPSVFRLAQIHKKCNRWEQAIAFFEACLRMQGNNEDSWFSKYMIGDCYEKMGQWDKALYWFLESFQDNPHRTESLHKIANYYRLYGKNDLAYLFAKHGSLLPFGENPLVSPLPTLSHYQFDEELSIAAYYTSFREEGLIACNQLLIRKNVPWEIKDQAYRNLLFYIRNLPDTQFQSIVFDLPLIREDSSEQYHPMNPSIQKTDKGYQVLCRTVNYTQVGAKFFQTIEPSGTFRTRNFLLEYDRDFHLLSQQEIIENLSREKFSVFNIEGLDDCRLFNLQGRTCFTCTTTDTSPTGVCQISFCRLADQLKEKTAVEKLVPLKGPDPYRHEKNWLPFVQEGQLYAIYSYDPLIIYRIHEETGQCIPLKSYNFPLDLSCFRGSAGPVPMDQGYLVLIHEVVHHLDYQRCYLHRFLFLNKDFEMTHLSTPFYFSHLGVEFCCGMTINHSENQLILGIGEEDREAFLCFVPLQTIRSLLQPAPRF